MTSGPPASLSDIAVAPGATVLVDFDHTVFAANSTVFIASCRPSFVAALLDLMIRRLVPWGRLGGASAYRLGDALCIALLCLLTPWNIGRWRRQAPALFRRHLAMDVVRRLEGTPADRLVIISFGFAFIIRALVAGSAFAASPLIATAMPARWRQLRAGKLDRALARLGSEVVRDATFITDSTDDADLLGACANGIRIAPQGKTTDARSRLYLPLRYASTVKYGRSYAIDQFLLVDAMIYVLATVQGPDDLGKALLVCPLFALSIGCVYEIGYFENDMQAARHEAKPVLGEHVARYRDYPIHASAWAWSLALAAAGILGALLLFGVDVEDLPRIATGWLLSLVLVRLAFYVYNRLPVFSRIYAYPCLQLLKYCPIFLVFTANLMGIFLVIGQAGAMWVTYIVYRLGGDKQAFSREHFRTAVFIGCVVVFAFGLHGWSLSDDRMTVLMHAGDWFSLWAISIWSMFRMLKVPLMRRLRSA